MGKRTVEFGLGLMGGALGLMSGFYEALLASLFGVPGAFSAGSYIVSNLVGQKFYSQFWGLLVLY